jgi:S-formylglutathione hydrolase FrmB
MPRTPAALLAACLFCTSLPAAGPLEFHLTFDKAAHDKPFTGRVYVMLFKGGTTALQARTNWFRPEPLFAKDVKGWKPGEKLAIDKTAQAYPTAMGRIAKGVYSVQAVMDFAPNSISFSRAPGNVYTVAPKLPLDPAGTGPVALRLDRVFEEPPFQETDRIKLVDLESRLLTAFHKRPTRMRAAVILPASYAKNPTKKYPVVYEIPGFTGNHHMAAFRFKQNVTNLDGVEVIFVVLDPNCRHGHHAFADSANNGPCGKALIEELIPALEKKFRAAGAPGGRAVTGHSSGGWSSLWLQTAYPDFFGGVWSTAPDPVDFRDFQKIDLYRAGENMFTDAEGKRRPIARLGKRPVLWYKGFSDMEEVMGRGGQLQSFEAVFGARGADGRPKRLWDRKTGALDPDVARSWEKYDIRLVLERNWKTLGPKLKGKLHVYMGEMDNFYLEGATRLLRQSLEKLGSDAAVELFPGKDHGSLMSKEMQQRIAREMAAMFKAAKVAE